LSIGVFPTEELKSFQFKTSKRSVLPKQREFHSSEKLFIHGWNR
jgi:hypothetical protein